MVNIRPSPNEPNEPGRSSSSSSASRPDRLIVHTSLLFNSKAKIFDKDISIEINTKTGLFTSVETRGSALPLQLAPNEIDLRGFTVLPGLTDAHSHIRLHAYSETTRNETSPLSSAY
jgi:dihydroorotase-like cyclic amidohydrolase